jgi:DNA-binding transcriptional LysR family regulator
MIRIDDLELFIRTAALGSFSNAAREAGLLPGQVSAAIQRLERELDIRLFARSTRSLKLTVEGEQYRPYAEEVLSVLREGQERLHGEKEALHGTLKLTMPSDIGRNVLLPWLTAFQNEHPRLVMKLSLSDYVTDVFRDPVDIAIRFGLFEHASYVTLPLAESNRRVLVASPRYIERHGRPRSLDELVMHHCLPFMLGGRIYDRWAFPDNGVRRQVAVKGSLLCDDSEIARRWAVDGRGIAYKSWLDVHDDVQTGRLEVLIPNQPGEAVPLNLVCPHRRQFSPVVRYLHAELRQHIEPMMSRMHRSN